MFAEFLDSIETTIDHVINTLAEDGTHLVSTPPPAMLLSCSIIQDVIGFCGGGSLMMYPIQRLRLRYEDNIKILDHADFFFKP
jgi:hypothetical protein